MSSWLYNYNPPSSKKLIVSPLVISSFFRTLALSVADTAKQYGIRDKTIYNWLEPPVASLCDTPHFGEKTHSETWLAVWDSNASRTSSRYILHYVYRASASWLAVWDDVRTFCENEKTTRAL